MQIPPFAEALREAVAECRLVDHAGGAGLVPGLLRSIAAPVVGLDAGDLAATGVGGSAHDQVLRLAVIAWNNRYIGLFHQRFRRILEAHGPNCLGRRPDEDQPCLLDFFHEFGIFRQEAVARMDRLRAGIERRPDDRVAAQIAVLRRRPADMDRLVGQRHVARAAVGVGIDRDRPHPATTTAAPRAAAAAAGTDSWRVSAA